MERLKSFEEFLTLSKNLEGLLDIKKGNVDSDKYVISVCSGTGCQASESKEIVETFNKLIKDYHLQDKVKCLISGCFGFCEKGPIVKISPDHAFYVKVRVEDCERIIKEHIIEHHTVEDLLYVNPLTNMRIRKQEDIPFYKKQHRIALRNCGFINPEDIKEYIASNGYSSLVKVLQSMTPEDVIKEVTDSGLRGRGGGGFPTGKKWALTRASNSEKKYVICNADEGDPGAFMDRSIMEGDPFSVIEAMTIAGYAIGSDEGVIYIRAEYPLAVGRLKIAIEQARKFGLLGKNILGTDFSFDIHIKFGAGAFVCGEETALIHSVEGERGEPTIKPPFPAVAGLFGKPTLVNNVETWANVPYIFNVGAKEFARIGTEKSKGTKVFALAGKINNVGLVEVPMGTTLREIIYDIGGGIKNNHKFKAAQTGGPSGGCIAEDNIDIPIDYDNLTSIGSMMGSGGLIVMDDTDCMVDIAKFYLGFTVEESCGKCTPCRIGNKRLYEILERICNGEGEEEDLEKLESLSNVIKDTALCGLGQSSPNPVLSTLKCFREEYEAHIKDKLCPAKKCKALARYHIDDNLCVGCGNCARKCPVEAIYKTDIKSKRNSKLFLYQIDDHKCIRCGTCESNCPLKAISL